MSASQARNWQQTWQNTTNPKKQEEPKRNRRVEVQVDKRWITPGEKVIYVLFSIILIGVLFFTVNFSSHSDTLNREVQQLQQDVKQQQLANENLQYQVKEYSSPDRILQIAKENGLQIQNTQVKQATALTN